MNAPLLLSNSGRLFSCCEGEVSVGKALKVLEAPSLKCTRTNVELIYQVSLLMVHPYSVAMLHLYPLQVVSDAVLFGSALIASALKRSVAARHPNPDSPLQLPDEVIASCD